MQMSKTYTPSEFEKRIYREWEEQGYFTAKIDADKLPFTIVIPPPNITGQLHMGHALNDTIQDIIIRFKRMQGYQCAVASGDRSRLHRDGSENRRADGAGGAHQGRRGQRGLFRARLGVEGTVRRPHRRTAEEHGLFLRLVAPCFHDGRKLLARGARSIREPLQQGADLQGRSHHQLVPVLQDRSVGRRGGIRGRGLLPLAHQVSGRRTATNLSSAPRPARKPCWETRQSRSIRTMPAMSFYGGEDGDSAPAREGDPRRCGRIRRDGIRYGRRENHACARSQRL